MLKLLGRTESNQLIFLYCVLLTTTMCTSQDNIIPVNILVGNNLNEDCKISGDNIVIEWQFQRSNETEFALLSSDYHDNTGSLIINNVQPHHEGLYRCMDRNTNAAGMREINITVLGVPWFVGCNNQAPCPRLPMNVTVGSSLVIDISLVFNDGGFRGVNQEIYAVKLRYPGTLIFVCIRDVDTRIIPNTEFTNRTSYTGQRSPWTNITVTVNDSVLNDSGLYLVEVVTVNENGDITTTISSSINITVTKAITPSTTHISPSAAITNTSTLQPTITSIASTAMSVIISSSTVTQLSLTDVSTTTEAQASPTVLSTPSTDSSTNIFIAASVLIVVLVPAVLLLGAVLVMFYVRYSRDDSKDKKSQDNGSEFPSPTDHLQNDQFNLEQTYNSKTEAV